MEMISKVPVCMIKGKQRKTIALLDHGGGMKTIRQMPDNYCIAICNCNPSSTGRWVTDTDLATDREISLFVFELLLNYPLRYDQTGQKIMDAIDEIVYKKKKDSKPDAILNTVYPQGQMTTEYRCPTCLSVEINKVSLMQGGANCRCKWCGTVFHVSAY